MVKLKYAAIVFDMKNQCNNHLHIPGTWALKILLNILLAAENRLLHM